MAAEANNNSTAAAAAAAAAPSSSAAATTSNNPPPPATSQLQPSPIKKTTTTSSSSSPSNNNKSKQSSTKSSDNAKTKKSPTKKSNSSSSSSSSSAAQLEKQLKLQKAEIAKRELKELEAMERAFRQDMDVWNGPSNVVFPRRYHTVQQLKSNGTAVGGGGGNNNNSTGTKKKGDKETTANNVYYGSQSQGWMYGDGLARMGGLSWMDVTTPPVNSSSNKRKKSSEAATTNTAADTAAANTSQQPSLTPSSTSGFLVDDITIIDKSLTKAGLTRSHLTPRAYACLLEQARRYTLELLADAQDYALHAQRDSIASLQPSDLLLAVEMREDSNGVASTLPRVEDVVYVAEEVNRVPLPSIPRDCYGGVRLPPVEEQLTARTFDVVNGARVVQKMMRGGDYPMGLSEVGNLGKKGGGGGSGGGGSGGRKTGSYGAAVGRQIAVHLKSGKGGSDEKSKAGGGGASAPAAASKASSGSKAQKRKLTEL
jgi:histone H3/H4